MSTIICAISGLKIITPHLESIHIPSNYGYFHPVFACHHSQIQKLYSKHCQGLLEPVDSYLTFLAILHSSECVTWKAPASIDPMGAECRNLVESNISQLVAVLYKTAAIKHPSFVQPKFVVTIGNSKLTQISAYIEAWQNNIDRFYSGYQSKREEEALQRIENRLTFLSLSGSDPKKLAATVADWADHIAEFPIDKCEDWKQTIRSCFNMDKMFNTPLDKLREIKTFCEINIDAGAVHFHCLMQVLKEGIGRNVNYLGGSSLALGYTLIDIDSTTNDAAVESMRSKAPATEPVKADYPTLVAYLKARTSYKSALLARANETDPNKKDYIL